LILDTCAGVFKLKNVQDAGAIGVVWADFGRDGGTGGVAYILQGEGVRVI
jgi:hypothetical protein